MRRDMDLLRLLLLKLETINEDPQAVYNYSYKELAVEGFSLEQVIYHLDLAVEAGLIDQGGSGAMNSFTFSRLTWDGHDFVDSVRDDEIWRKTRQGANAAGAFTLEMVKELAKGFIKKKIADHTGIQI